MYVAIIVVQFHDQVLFYSFHDNNNLHSYTVVSTHYLKVKIAIKAGCNNYISYMVISPCKVKG